MVKSDWAVILMKSAENRTIQRGFAGLAGP
jgi:hypothetical protein